MRGEQDWGTPDELDAAFAHTTENIQLGLPLMWRDRWWRMFDRDPIETWVHGRIALLGDAAHPPLQYIAQGAIMAIEDGYVLAEHLAATGRRRRAPSPPTRPSAPSTAAGSSPPPAPGANSGTWTATQRDRRNQILRARDPHDYSFTDWLYSTTALTPSQEPRMFTPIPLEAPTPAAAP